MTFKILKMATKVLTMATKILIKRPKPILVTPTESLPMETTTKTIRACSICKGTDHNKRNCKQKSGDKSDTADLVVKDAYTSDLLKTRYLLHKTYVTESMKFSSQHGVKFRLPCIPEDISENMIKFIIHKKGDTTSSWDCGKGDLMSKKEGKQECKCFTSDGPPSFTPSSHWDVIYFLDARHWLEDKFVLYKVNLKRTSETWKNVNVSKTQTFDDQCKQGRRPRITWESLYPQIASHTEKIFEGTFEDIFTV